MLMYAIDPTSQILDSRSYNLQSEEVARSVIQNENVLRKEERKQAGDLPRDTLPKTSTSVEIP